MGKYPLVSLFILLGFFLGWGPSAEGESFCEAGNRTRVLHITFYEGDACQTMRQLVAAYPNAQVIIDCPPFNQWRVSMWNDFYLGKNGTYELAILDSQLLAQGVIQGHLKELTGFLHHRSELLDDFYPSIFASYSEFPLGSKRFYGIPIIGDVQVLAYRKSIFHTIAQDDIDSLSTLLQVARQISTTPALNISGYTTAWCANFAECYDAAATTWNQIAWSFGGELWDHNTYQVRGVLDQPLNELALNFSQELVQYGPPGSLSFTSRDAMQSICDGQVAMAAIWGRHAYDIVSPTCTFADDILFTVFPGASHHSLSLSGQGIHVNDHVSSERQSAAMCFLDWILATEQQKEFVRLGGISPRKSILSTGFFINRAPFHGIFVVSYPLVKDFWNLPEYSQLLEIQMSYLQLALNGTLTSAKALSQTARQQQEIINDSYPNGPPPPNLQLAKISLGALLSILIVAVIFMIIIAGLAVWIWVFRDEPIIRYSSPIFMLFILLGLALLLSSLFTYLDSPIDTAACRLHLWLSVLGTFLALAPILAKTWRITVIWIRATQLKSRVIPNRTVLSVLAVLMVLPVTVLSVWTPFYETQTLYYEPEIDSYLVRCSKHYLEIFLTILVVYLGLLGCSAACMAFLTRNVYTEFNESRYLAIIIYNSTLLGAVFLPLIFFLSEDPTIIFLLEAGAILSWSALILLGLFGPKLYTQIAGLDDLDRSQSFHPTPPSQFRNSQSPSSSPLHLTPLPFP